MAKEISLPFTIKQNGLSLFDSKGDLVAIVYEPYHDFVRKACDSYYDLKPINTELVEAVKILISRPLTDEEKVEVGRKALAKAGVEL